MNKPINVIALPVGMETQSLDDAVSLLLKFAKAMNWIQRNEKAAVARINLLAHTKLAVLRRINSTPESWEIQE